MEMADILAAINWIGAIGCGVMAGVYFTFSAFAMQSFAAIDVPAGIAAMQSINRVIQKSLFLPLFFGTSLAALAAVAIYFLGTDGAGLRWTALAGGTYFVGMFVVTVALNIPLNNRLDAVDPHSEDGAMVWKMYLKTWTYRNHIRTVSSLLATIMFVLALAG